jgi:hypothetical protein
MDWQWPPHPEMARHTFRHPNIMNGIKLNDYIGFVDPDREDGVSRTPNNVGKVVSTRSVSD